MRVHVEGADEPFWLVLGQSENAGWHATTDGATLGDRTLVDGYANGWLVDPTQESFDVVLEWTPQERVWASLWVSLAGVLACLAIVAVTWWRRRRGGLARNTAPDPADARDRARVARAHQSAPQSSRRARLARAHRRPRSSARWSRRRGSGCSSVIAVALALRWRAARGVPRGRAGGARSRSSGLYIAVRAGPVPDAAGLRMADRVPARAEPGVDRGAARGRRGRSVDLTRRAAARRADPRR